MANKWEIRMKRLATGGLGALVLVGVVALLSMASIGSAAPTERQYNKPTLTLSVTHFGVGPPPDSRTFYYMRVDGAGYAEGDTPSGTVTITCGKGPTCGPFIASWAPAQPVGASGAFISNTMQFNCPSNVKSAIANDTVYSVKSNSVKTVPC